MYTHCRYMKTQLAKWGNSLALRIPRSVAAAAEALEGTEVEVTFEAGAIVVRPVARRYALDDLVEGITPKNTPDNIDWGSPLGDEVW